MGVNGHGERGKLAIKICLPVYDGSSHDGLCWVLELSENDLACD
jgi:hypothetical protein